ncbi:MAG: hypothetical protein ACW967_05980 [Candidatus Hodarchaeales archaeon]|jgi:hypothetical protein
MFSKEEKIKIALFYNLFFQDMVSRLSKDEVLALGSQINIIDGVGVIQVKSLPFLFFNYTCGLGFQQSATEEVINKIINQFETLSEVPYALRVSEELSQPKTLSNLLTNKFKFVKNSNQFCFIRKLEDIPEKKGNLRIQKINDKPEFHQDFIDITVKGFEIPEQFVKAFTQFTSLLLSPRFTDSFKSFLAFDRDIPISTATVYVNNDEKIAWLGNAATLKEHRGKGGQGDLIIHRLQVAKEHGCILATVETGDDTPEKRNPSYHNILRYGFSVAIKYGMYTKVS